MLQASTGRLARLIALEVMYRADIGMVQRRNGTRLALEAPATLRVTGERLWQHFDGDAPVKPRVLGLVDLPHAALAEQRYDLEAA
jgi:hypothetical protein